MSKHEIEKYGDAYYSMVWFGEKGYPEHVNSGRCYMTGMLGMLRSGLDVEWVVQAAFDSLNDFHEGIARFERHEALKVVFFPEGEEAAERRKVRV